MLCHNNKGCIIQLQIHLLDAAPEAAYLSINKERAQQIL